jgi:hypothetical protein
MSSTAVERAEPVRRPGAELDRLAHRDRELLASEQQPQAAVQDVDLFVPLVHDA